MSAKSAGYFEVPLVIGDTKLSFFVGSGLPTDSVYHSEWHFHSFFEMFYVRRGCVTIVAGDRECRLNAGDMALVPEGIVHSVFEENGTQCHVISYRVGKAPKNSGIRCYSSFLKLLSSKNILVFYDFPAKEAYDRLAGYYASDRKYKSELICACLHEIIATVLEENSEGSVGSAFTLESSDYRSFIVDNYINIKYSSDASLSGLASELHMSRSQTQRTVKKIYGLSFREKILEKRLEYACALLRETPLSVSDISQKAGYAYTQNFSTSFVKRFGVSPEEYRKVRSEK